MRKLVLLASISLLFTLTGLNEVAAQGEGIIEGQVINATADNPSESLAGLEIGLYLATSEAVEFIGTTTTDRGGRFRFGGLDTDDEYSYRLELEYEDITYNDERGFLQEEAIMPVVITIYETTDDEEAIVVNRHHIIIDFVGDTMAIQEMHILENTTDTIYVGEDEKTLRFSLPADATDLRLDDHGVEYNTIGTDEGFASIVPVIPGQSQVLFSYTLPYNGQDHTLVRKIMYPTTDLELMIADVGVLAESRQLAYQGLTGGEESSYLHFEARDLLPNAEIEIHLSGAPQATARPLPESSLGLGLQRVSPWIALGLALLGALLPFVQVYRRERSQRTRDSRTLAVLTIEHANSELRAQREELLQLIADLDDAFAERQIGEEAYRELRKSMKRRLMDMGPELEVDRRD
jgi:5-hydroxyisourate hydrolase-like protein (transthyretin family)